MPKEFDIKVLNAKFIGAVDSVFERMLHVKPGAEPVVAEKDIIEFESRMRLFPMEKFNGPCYIGVINYYLAEKDMNEGRAVGTFVFYIKEECAERLLKAFNRSIKDAEHEEILLDVVGEFAQIIAKDVKNDLADMGYADLLISSPQKYKNHVLDGAPFDYELYQKQEITFSFWGQKSVVLDVCMGHVPLKSR